jgi:hypothetical protein
MFEPDGPFRRIRTDRIHQTTPILVLSHSRYARLAGLPRWPARAGIAVPCAKPTPIVHSAKAAVAPIATLTASRLNLNG